MYNHVNLSFGHPQSARLYMPVPPLPPSADEAAGPGRAIQRKFHSICLLSHNGARCSSGSGAEDEAEA